MESKPLFQLLADDPYLQPFEVFNITCSRTSSRYGSGSIRSRISLMLKVDLIRYRKVIRLMVCTEKRIVVSIVSGLLGRREFLFLGSSTIGKEGSIDVRGYVSFYQEWFWAVDLWDISPNSLIFCCESWCLASKWEPWGSYSRLDKLHKAERGQIVWRCSCGVGYV